MVHGFRRAVGRVVHGVAPFWLCRVAAVCLIAILLPGAGSASELQLPVPRVTIYPGDTISEGMLVERTFRDRDVEGQAMISAREQIVGKVARQTLLPNQPVSVAAVREPHAVKQGQPAVVIFQSGGLIISATAMPLQAGAVGEVISLRNTESGTTIRGIIQPDGTVRVGGP